MDEESVAGLNARFSLDRAVEFSTGQGGLRVVRLLHYSGATVEVYLHGAHVVSWTIPGGDDLLFLSHRTRFAHGQAIRGGIPLIFPQFSERGPLPRHGFARTQVWEVIETRICEFQAVHLTLRLEDSEATRAVWPHSFCAELEIILSQSLEMKLKVTNRDTRAFACQALFHNYFSLSDITRAQISYLQGRTYLDQLCGNAEGQQQERELELSSAIDRIYRKTPDYVMLRDKGCRRLLRLYSIALDDTVVWNPGRETCREMEDMQDEDYREMICLEPGNVMRPKLLAPGAEWKVGQQLSFDHY